MLQPSSNTTIDLKQTAHLYGGIKAYEKAQADGLTKLDFEPWLIARSAEFKTWFGDWESAASYRFLESGSIFDSLLGALAIGDYGERDWPCKP